MQVWNVLQAARWKYRMQKWCKKSPSEHHRTILSGYIFATKACIDNQIKHTKQQYLLQMSLQYGELQPSNGWDRLAGLGHPIIFQWVSRLGSVTARQSSSGRQPNFAALNRGCHLCLAGQPSRWVLAHILVYSCVRGTVPDCGARIPRMKFHMVSAAYHKTDNHMQLTERFFTLLQKRILPDEMLKTQMFSSSKTAWYSLELLITFNV